MSVQVHLLFQPSQKLKLSCLNCVCGLCHLSCRVLAHYRFDSVQGADEHLTQLLVLKLYKEYSDSAFAVWAQHKTPDVTSLLGSAAAVEAVAAAATAVVAAAGTGSSAAAALSAAAAKTVLQEVLAARKQVGTGWSASMYNIARGSGLSCNFATTCRHPPSAVALPSFGSWVLAAFQN